MISFKDSIPINVKYIVFDPVFAFNPLIYAVEIRYFRVAFIQLLLLRKTVRQAEQFERTML